MGNKEDGFMVACLDAPDDVVPLLIWADYCADQGDKLAEDWLRWLAGPYRALCAASPGAPQVPNGDYGPYVTSVEREMEIRDWSPGDNWASPLIRLFGCLCVRGCPGLSFARVNGDDTTPYGSLVLTDNPAGFRSCVTAGELYAAGLIDGAGLAFARKRQGILMRDHRKRTIGLLAVSRAAVNCAAPPGSWLAYRTNRDCYDLAIYGNNVSQKAMAWQYVVGRKLLQADLPGRP